jgi:hypothetical protein
MPKKYFFYKKIPLEKDIDGYILPPFQKKNWQVHQHSHTDTNQFIRIIFEYYKEHDLKLPEFLSKNDSQEVVIQKIRQKIVTLYQDASMKQQVQMYKGSNAQLVKEDVGENLPFLAQFFNAWFCIYNETTKNWHITRHSENLSKKKNGVTQVEFVKYMPQVVFYFQYDPPTNFRLMKPLLKLAPPSKKCNEDEIMNPKTNRCVKKSGAVGKKILAGNVDNEKQKKCKDDEILNPKTNRCVKKSGAVGKKLLGVKVQKGPPKCKEDEVYNPETNRCVKKSGSVGKAILAEKKLQKLGMKKPKMSKPMLRLKKLLNKKR